MAQLIQFKRRIPGTGAPGTLAAGEPAVSVTAAGVADMYVGDGSAVRVLVSDQRQVELDGPQTIVGAKTLGTGGSLTSPIANMHIQGGAAGQLLSTDGAGALSWIAPPAAGLPTFSNLNSYTVGEFVSHAGHIYRARVAVTPGAFDPSEWDRVALLSDIPSVTAGTTPPTPADAGDLFFNTTLQQLFAYNGTAWVLANHVAVGAAAPTPASTGMAWFHSGTHVLSVYDGSAWVAATGARSYTNATAPGGSHTAGDIWWSPAGPQVWSGTAWVAMALGATGLEDLEIEDPLHGDGLTTATALGVTPATTGQVTTGSDDVFPVTSLKLRQQMGFDRLSLATGLPQTVIGAINALAGQIAAVSGALRFAGSYDVDQDDVDPVTPPIVPAGTLPAPTAYEGAYLIVTVAGTGHGNAPAVRMEVGDWLVSTGAVWVHVPLHHASVTASNVSITAVDSQTWSNVQAALQGIFTRISTAGNTPVLADHVSVLGDGTSAANTATVGTLRVGTVDGGTF